MASVGGFFKGLGKGLLKAAPIAANFIPGVGPLAAMGIGAATGGLSSKLAGGSALGGALGGATQAGMGGMIKGGIKGLGPSNPNFMGPQQSLGSKLGNLPWGNIAKGAAIGGGALMAGKALAGGGQKQGQGIGPSYGGFENRTPNLENYLGMGRMEAMQNQPWRQQRGIFPQMPMGGFGMGMSPWMNPNMSVPQGRFGNPEQMQQGGMMGGLGPQQMPPWMMQRQAMS